MLTVDVVYGDAFKEVQHPRARSGAKGGQFVAKGQATGGTPAARPERGAAAGTGQATTARPDRPGGQGLAGTVRQAIAAAPSWEPPETNKWGVSQSDAWAKSRSIAAKPEAHESADLHEAMRHLRPGFLNKIDRANRLRIAMELVKRGEGEKPTNKPPASKVEPTKVEPKTKTEPAKPPSEPEKPKSGAPDPEAAFAGRSAPETAWHKASWQHADPAFLHAVANTPPVIVVPADAGGAYYHPGRHQIAMPREVTQYGQGTWRHEFGHAIDYGGTVNNLSSRYHDTLMAEGDAVVAKYGSYGPATILGVASRQPEVEKSGQPLPVGFMSTQNNNYNVAGFSDFLGAMTRNRIGFGHSNAYYEKAPRRHTSEAFANYVSMTQSEHGPLFKAVLHHLAPKTCAGFDKIIADRAEGKA